MKIRFWGVRGSIASPGPETATIRVGFRSISIVDGVLTVNGRRVLFRGVNRHEFDPVHGRVMSEEVVERRYLEGAGR